MAEVRVRLLPSEGVAPRLSRLPLTWVRRWRSPWDPDASPAVDVFVNRRAVVRVCAHAGSDLEREVGGALVGTWRQERGTGRAFVVVDSALRARHTRQGNSHVTFTQDTLVALHEELEQRYPGKLFVGWYHTHPNFGVFLSGYDAWLHEHFFSEAWQIALVVDPQAKEGGFFVWGQDGSLDPRGYVGFYELLPSRRDSVVTWRNLSPESEAGG